MRNNRLFVTVISIVFIIGFVLGVVGLGIGIALSDTYRILLGLFGIIINGYAIGTLIYIRLKE